jgi:hypothetical protein
MLINKIILTWFALYTAVYLLFVHDDSHLTAAFGIEWWKKYSDRTVMQHWLKCLLMVAIQNCAIGLTNTQYAVSIKNADAGHIIL